MSQIFALMQQKSLVLDSGWLIENDYLDFSSSRDLTPN